MSLSNKTHISSLIGSWLRWKFGSRCHTTIRKTPLKDAKKKVTKLHPAMELLNSLNVAVEKANMVKIKAKKDDLEFFLKKSNEDIHLKSRELGILEKKVDQEVERQNWK